MESAPSDHEMEDFIPYLVLTPFVVKHQLHIDAAIVHPVTRNQIQAIHPTYWLPTSAVPFQLLPSGPTPTHHCLEPQQAELTRLLQN